MAVEPQYVQKLRIQLKVVQSKQIEAIHTIKLHIQQKLKPFHYKNYIFSKHLIHTRLLIHCLRVRNRN